MERVKSAASVLGVWLIIMSVLTILSPSAKEVTSPTENGGLPATAGSVIANKALEDAFLPLLHTVTGIVKYK